MVDSLNADIRYIPYFIMRFCILECDPPVPPKHGTTRRGGTHRERTSGSKSHRTSSRDSSHEPGKDSNEVQGISSSNKPPPLPPKIRQKTVTGNVSIYECDKGYLLHGSKIRECLPNGEWRGIVPTCQRE